MNSLVTAVIDKIREKAYYAPMKRRALHLFSLVYLFYFSIYAVTPLSYTYEPRQDAEHATINSPRLFIIELLLFKVAKQGSKDSETKSANLLLKKKRAVLSSSKVKASENAIKKIAVIPDDFRFAGNPSLTVAVQCNGYIFQKDFYYFHTDLPPPLA